MSTPAIVWLVVGLLGTAALIAMTVALVRHGLVLGRTVSRFQREASPEIEGMSRAREARTPRR